MKKIDWIFAVRHGDYIGVNLTEKGIRQSEDTATKIKNCLNGGAIHLFYSPLSRAVETAEIIRVGLGTENIHRLDGLAGDTHRHGEKASEEIERAIPESDSLVTIIVVSHYEAPSGIIHGFASRYCGSNFMSMVAPYGGGFKLDLKTGVAGLID